MHALAFPLACLAYLLAGWVWSEWLDRFLVRHGLGATTRRVMMLFVAFWPVVMVWTIAIAWRVCRDFKRQQAAEQVITLDIPPLFPGGTAQQISLRPGESWNGIPYDDWRKLGVGTHAWHDVFREDDRDVPETDFGDNPDGSDDFHQER